MDLPTVDMFANPRSEEFKALLAILAAAVRSPDKFAGQDNQASSHGVLDLVRRTADGNDGLLIINTTQHVTIVVQIASIQVLALGAFVHPRMLPSDFIAFPEMEEVSS